MAKTAVRLQRADYCLRKITASGQKRTVCSIPQGKTINHNDDYGEDNYGTFK
jgi:hypothetical protein